MMSGDEFYDDDVTSGPIEAEHVSVPRDNCACGSGQPSEWEYDAQGIPLCRVCPKCRKQKLSRYRPEILSGYTQADVDEPIEEEG